MTEEEKQLLIKDLCARLPYEIKGIRTYKPEEIVTLGEIIPRCQMNPNVGNGSFCELGFDEISDCCTIAEFKPYLRPMSSMTEEENKVAREKFFDGSDHYDIDDIGEIYADTYQPYTSVYTLSFARLSGYIDWLNAHHFDYHRLISMGLALEAKEGMYKF